MIPDKFNIAISKLSESLDDQELEIIREICKYIEILHKEMGLSLKETFRIVLEITERGFMTYDEEAYFDW